MSPTRAWIAFLHVVIDPLNAAPESNLAAASPWAGLVGLTVRGLRQ